MVTHQHNDNDNDNSDRGFRMMLGIIRVQLRCGFIHEREHLIKKRSLKITNPLYVYLYVCALLYIIYVTSRTSIWLLSAVT